MKLMIRQMFTLAWQIGEQGWHSAESACLPQCGPGSIPGLWVEFVVGCHPCSERFFSGYSGFPFSSKTNISKVPI